MNENDKVQERTFSVKTVAEILQTNEETVRRWIREGKLEAEIQSKKKGYTVTEKQLADFLGSSAKYSGASLMLAALFPSIAALVPSGVATLATAAAVGAVGAKLLKQDEKSEEVSISDESLSDFLQRQIKESMERIQEIEKQMMLLSAKLDAYQTVLRKNQSFEETEPSVSQRSMSEYLTRQTEEIMQEYRSMEQELLVATEQLKVYQDSWQALKEIP